MKRLFFPLLLLTCAHVHAPAQEPYYCTAGGTVLNYLRTNVENGRTVWNHRMEVKESEREGEVCCKSSFTDSKGNGIASVEYTAYIGSDGSVTTDLNSTMVSAIRNFFPKADIEADYSPTTLPGILQPGDTLANASSVVRVLGKPFNTSVTERSVLRTETIETPAGTFFCTVVTEHKTEKFILYNRDTVSYTWYARGLGMIRHDTWKNGRRETSEVLVSVNPRTLRKPSL